MLNFFTVELTLSGDFHILTSWQEPVDTNSFAHLFSIMQTVQYLQPMIQWAFWFHYYYYCVLFFFQNHADLVASSHFRPWEIHGCVFSASLRSHCAGAALIDPPQTQTEQSLAQNKLIFIRAFPQLHGRRRSDAWCFSSLTPAEVPVGLKLFPAFRLETPSSRGITRQPACCLCLNAVLFPTFGF